MVYTVRLMRRAAFWGCPDAQCKVQTATATIGMFRQEQTVHTGGWRPELSRADRRGSPMFPISAPLLLPEGPLVILKGKGVDERPGRD